MILKRFNVERVTDDPSLIQSLKAEGFEVVSGKEPEQPRPKNLKDLNKDQLVKLAGERGIEGAKSLNKKELLEILEEGEDDGTDSSAGGEDSDEA